jgi:hypothetical protein
MIRIVLLGEDAAHEDFLRALLERLQTQIGVPLDIKPRSSFRGGSRVFGEIDTYMRELEKGMQARPDLLVVAVDANCKGLQNRRQEVLERIPSDFRDFTVLAIPDPHIERWMLLDSAAFRRVLGKGCAAPDMKCERDRYKKMLRDEIRAAGYNPIMGGMEWAGDLLKEMDFSRIHDKSLKTFLDEMEKHLRSRAAH